MKYDKKFVLVLSGGGSKCFYSLGILKSIVELGIDSCIEASFGVSAGAMILCYRASGKSIDQIYNIFLANINLLSAKNLKLPPISSLIQEKPILEMYKKHLPNSFEQLGKKIYIGATDLYSGTYQIFNTGDLLHPLLGSISLPVIFPPVKFKNYMLADGGIVDNFPVIRAKKIFPEHEIIGVTVSSFKKNQKISNLLSSALVAFNLALSKDIEGNILATNHLFFRDTGISTTETDIKKIEKIYNLGYRDGLRYFTNYMHQ